GRAPSTGRSTGQPEVGPHIPARIAAVRQALRAFDGQRVLGAGELLDRLRQLPAWGALSEQQRRFVAAVRTAPGDEVLLIRARLAAVLNEAAFRQRTPEDQAARVMRALQPELPADPTRLLAMLRGHPAWQRLTPDERAAFEQGLRTGASGD